jgi:uncharacterized coiled-coil DUF342 family protein
VEPQVEAQEQLKSLESEKERMIARYMSLQDQADAVNEEIYKVCCGVETLNVRISALKEEMRRAAMKAAAPANGKAHPPTNGKAH